MFLTVNPPEQLHASRKRDATDINHQEPDTELRALRTALFSLACLAHLIPAVTLLILQKLLEIGSFKSKWLVV